MKKKPRCPAWFFFEGGAVSEQDLFELYQSRFKPMYADLVAVTGEKSLVVDAQIESAMSHLAVSRTNGGGLARQANIDAAYGHVVRACADAAKLYWLSRFKRVKFILNDDYVSRWCLNISYGDFVRLHTEAEHAIKGARRVDAETAGHDVEEVFQKYVLAIQKYEAILASVDPYKLDNIRPFRLLNIVKSQFIGFILGVCASIAATLLYEWWKS